MQEHEFSTDETQANGAIHERHLLSVVEKLTEENSRLKLNERKAKRQVITLQREIKNQQPISNDTDTSQQHMHERSWYQRANTHLSIGLGALAIDGGLVVTSLAFPDEILLFELPYFETCMPGIVAFFGLIGLLGLGSGLVSELKKYLRSR